MDAIVVKNLCKSYKLTKALDNVSFDIKENELFGLLGVNGAGKTTIVSIMSGLINRNSGEVKIMGYDIDSDIKSIQSIINVSTQESSIASRLTVYENLCFFMNVYNTNDYDLVEDLINKFSLNEVRNKMACNLSGGFRRRLSIAISLISKPKILFLDEPTLGLDVLARRELWKIIRELKSKITIILTSHYLEEIEALCDRTLILVKGKKIECDTVSNIKEKYNASSLEDAFVKMVEGVNNEVKGIY